MPTPKDDPKILSQWQKIFVGNIAKGIKKYNVYRLIGEAYGVSYSTVRYHIDLEYRARNLQVKHERYKKRSRKKIVLRRYNRNYRRLKRNPERFLATIFQSQEHASVEEISGELRELTEGLSFRPSTIQRILDRYIKNEMGPPFLEQLEADVYQIRDPPEENMHQKSYVDDGF